MLYLTKNLLVNLHTLIQSVVTFQGMFPLTTNDHKPSYAQANHMHKDFAAGTLTGEKMEEMLSSDKPNQKPVFKLSAEKFEKYIASDVSNKEAEDFFLKACDYYSKYLIRKRDKDAR